MMDCRDVRAAMDLGAGDDLPAGRQREFTTHLAGCAACRAAASAVRRDLDWLGEAGAGPVPGPPPGRVDAAVAAARTGGPAAPRRRFRILPASAALAAGLALAVLGLRVLTPEPVSTPPAETAGVSWKQLQTAFGHCLDEPVALSDWHGSDGGVATVLAPVDGGFRVAACLEARDLQRLRRFPWSEQRLRRWRGLGDGTLVVAVCRTDTDDRSERRERRREALMRLSTF